MEFKIINNNINNMKTTVVQQNWNNVNNKVKSGNYVYTLSDNKYNIITTIKNPIKWNR